MNTQCPNLLLDWAPPIGLDFERRPQPYRSRQQWSRWSSKSRLPRGQGLELLSASSRPPPRKGTSSLKSSSQTPSMQGEREEILKVLHPSPPLSHRLEASLGSIGKPGWSSRQWKSSASGIMSLSTPSTYEAGTHTVPFLQFEAYQGLGTSRTRCWRKEP